jgi:hypothetical protein
MGAKGFGLFVLLGARMVWAGPVVPPDVASLVDKCPVIVVGSLSSAVPATDGKGWSVGVTVVRAIAGGNAAGDVINAEFYTSAVMGNPSGEYGLWFFVANTSGSGPQSLVQPAWQNASSIMDAFIAVPTGALPSQLSYQTTDPTIDKLAVELLAASQAQDSRVSGQAFHALTSLTNAYVMNRHAQLYTVNHTLAGCALAQARASLGTSIATSVQSILQSSQKVPLEMSMALCAVDDPGAVSTLGQVLSMSPPNSGLRRCAARALRNIHTSDAAVYLGSMLSDTDPQVQYAGIMGLGNAALNVVPGGDGGSGGRDGPRVTSMTVPAVRNNLPTFATFQSNPQPYLAFWERWAANHAPVVSLNSGQCHPFSPTQPCTVTFNASATDADGDTLAYHWLGCSSASASCSFSVADIQAHTVQATATDGWGGATSAAGTATGVTDQIPHKSGGTGCGSAPEGGTAYVTVQVQDDSAKGTCSVTGVSGPCTVTISVCSNNVVQAAVHGKAPGQNYCSMTLHYTNVWGQSMSDPESCYVN